MILLVLFGGLCGSLNNVFVHMAGQNIGNNIRKDCFRRIMSFSFPQMDAFSTGSLVTRVTNDITQVQNFVSQFVRGMVRTTMLTFGSIYCMFRLNWTFGLVVLCAFPLLVGCIALCMAKANPLFSKLQSQLDQAALEKEKTETAARHAAQERAESDRRLEQAWLDWEAACRRRPPGIRVLQTVCDSACCLFLRKKQNSWHTWICPKRGNMV